MYKHIHSHEIVLNHDNYGMRLCAVCSMRCAGCGCPAFEFMQCAAVCGKEHCCVRQCSIVRGSVRLSGGPARGSVLAAVQRCGNVRQSGSEHIFK
jgi:hypothetical protein